MDSGHESAQQAQDKCDDDSLLILRMLIIIFMAAHHDVHYLLEHPADPQKEPYPSFWITDQANNLVHHVGGVLIHFDQADLGQRVCKLTTEATTLTYLRHWKS